MIGMWRNLRRADKQASPASNPHRQDFASGAQAPLKKSLPARRARLQRRSPLARQLLSFNLLALTIPTIGLLYLGDYGRSFSEIERDFASSTVEIIAATVAQRVQHDAEVHFATEETNENLLSEELFARLINAAALHDGTLYIYVLDPYRETETQDAFTISIHGRLQSAFMFGIPPEREATGNVRAVWQIRISDFLLGLKTDLLPDNRSLLNSLPQEAIEASPNFTSTRLRRTVAGDLISAAASGVSGLGGRDMVFFMVRDASRLDIIMLAQFKRVVLICLAALFFALFLSIIMYARFVHPIQMLAAASEQLGLGVGRTVRFPMASERKDELGELTRALARMANSLQTRLQSAEGFAADLAHEIKNPLASLRNSASLLADSRDPETSQKLKALVQKDIGRLNALINEILAASRLQTDLLVGQETPTSLRDLLNEISKMMLPAQGTKNLQLEIDLPPEDQPCLVLAHEHRMAEALRNIFLNAVSFSPEGGRVMIGLRPEPPPETLASNADFPLPKDGYWIAVEDQGPGIVPGKEERIFERFYTERAQHKGKDDDSDDSDDTDHEERHFGLGLDNVRQVMQAHHGFVWARNHQNQGGGAGFYLFLPAYRPPTKKSGKKEPTAKKE